MAKESWRHLLHAQNPERVLSPEWLHHQPSEMDFGLENVNISSVYAEYQRFINAKKKRLDELEKSKPAPPQPKFSWEYAAALVFMVGMIVYQIISKQPNPIIFSIFALGAVFFVLIIFWKYYKENSRRKKEHQKIVAQQVRINHSRFEQEDIIDLIEEYAAATADYLEWEQRTRPNYWMKMTKNEIAANLISMFKENGQSAGTGLGDFIDIIYSAGATEHAVYISFKKATSLAEVNQFIKVCSEESLVPGIIISLKGIDSDAITRCVNRHIHMWTIDDIIDFEYSIEEKCVS